MATNSARRASDGRRSRNRAYNENAKTCRTSYLAGTAALELVASNPPKPKLVARETPVIPGLLSVGRRVAIFETAPLQVTFAGVPRLWSRERVNEVITVYRALKAAECLKCKEKTAKVETPTVLMLPAQCATAKPATEQGLATAA